MDLSKEEYIQNDKMSGNNGLIIGLMYQFSDDNIRNVGDYHD